jgi:RNA polymerase sigma-70 factor (ECF subfamily)
MDPLAASRLQRIFECCNPSLDADTQVALTLHEICGLSFAQVARAFVLPTTTMARWLTNAKAKLRRAGDTPDVPWQERIPAVMVALYLVFNEGYAAADGHHERNQWCQDAIVLLRHVASFAAAWSS